MKSNELNYLTADHIIHIHKRIIETDPLSVGGIQSFGNIEAAAERPRLSLSKPDGKAFVPYQDIFSKAAALLEALCQRHGFNDGNKRTALITTSIFLQINGYYLIPVIHSIRFTITIADKRMKTDLDYVRKWIKLNTTRYRRISILRLNMHNLKLSLFLLLGTVLFPKYVDRKFDYWMAFDIDPRYKEEWMKRLEYWARRQSKTQKGK